MKNLLSFFILSVCLISCISKDIERTLLDVESFIAARPVEKPCARDPRSPVPLTLAVQNSLTL